MRCQRVRELLTSRVVREDVLNFPADAGRHLEGCPDCRNYAGAIEANCASLASLKVAEPGPGFDERLRAGLLVRAKQLKPARRTRISSHSPKLAYALTVLLAAVVSGSLWVAHRSHSAIDGVRNSHEQVALKTVPPVHREAKQEPSPLHKSPFDFELPGMGKGTGNRISTVEHQNRASGIPAENHYLAGVQRNSPDDIHYINVNAADVLTGWGGLGKTQTGALQARVDLASRSGDDFVRVPFPRIASIDARGDRAATAAYQKEKEVVDARLSRRIELGVKAMAFSDLCAQLKEQTGIDLKARRSVADEKVTLFCHDTQLRDIMRQITHVFGFQWGRSGEEGAYRYELSQDLRGQLSEEELRNHDLAAALVALDEKIADSHYTEAQPLWAVNQLYQQLSPQQFAALRSGQEVRFSSARQLGGSPMPAEITSNILKTFGIRGANSDGSAFTPTEATVTLRLSHSELGEATIVAERGGMSDSGGGLGEVLNFGTAQSPSVAKPDNAKTNAVLRTNPKWMREVTLQPRHTCPHPKGAGTGQADAPPLYSFGIETDPNSGEPHVTSGDVWEELFRQTGMPVVADSYMRLYTPGEVTMQRAPLFDALCRIGDALGVRWRVEDGFLQSRSTSFFWDKVKEAPNRFLDHWEKDLNDSGVLPLEDVLEISTLTDQQLNSKSVRKFADQCLGLREWGLVGGYSDKDALLRLRPHARMLARMTPSQKQESLQPGGVPIGQLAQDVRQELAELWLKRWNMSAANLQGTRIHIDYAPAGSYVWYPEGLDFSMQQQAYNFPLISGKDADAVLAAARKVFSQATPNQVRRSVPLLVVRYIPPDSDPKAFVWTIGQPPATFRVPK
jgi:hypothetical protein